MKKIAMVGLTIFFILGLEASQTNQVKPNAEAGAKYFRLMLNDDASSTMVIGFAATTNRTTDHVLYYDVVDHGQSIQSYAYSANPAVIHNYRGMYNAFVRLKDLKADTAYYFVIKDPQGISRRYWFKTSPNDPNVPLSIIAGGDSRNNRTPRRNANILVSKLRPNAVMFGGDMTGGGSEKEWREWFEDWQYTISADGRMYPVIAARGNHEAANEMIEKLFDTPQGVYYGVSFGRDLLRIYTLNSESGISGTQTTWLHNDLHNSQDFKWRFAQYHRPMRPHTRGKADGSSHYKSWAELFYLYQVQFVSESDAHTLKVTWPVRPSSDRGSSEGFIRDDHWGTVYFGEGCWGAPLRSNNDDKPWTRNSGKYNHFGWLKVTNDQVELKTIIVDNASEVGSVTDDNRFQDPSRLNVWKPSNGSIVVVPARPKPSQMFAKEQSL